MVLTSEGGRRPQRLTQGAINELNAGADRAAAGRNRSTVAELQKIQAAEKESLAQLKNMRERDLRGIEDKRQSREGQLLAEQDTAIATAKRDRDAAIAEWREAIGKANALPSVDSNGLKSFAEQFGGDNVKRLFEGATAGVSQAAQRSTGTFSGFAASQLGLGSASLEQLQKDQVEQTKKTNQKIDTLTEVAKSQRTTGGLSFS